MQQQGLYDEFWEIVKGFADSYQFLKKILLERKKQKGKFSVGALVKDYLPANQSYNLHYAIYDVQALEPLLLKVVQNETTIKTYAESIVEIDNQKDIKNKKASIKADWLKYKLELTNSTNNKWAAAGITYEIMRVAFENNGEKGLYVLCVENVDNKPTPINVKILQSIYSVFTTKP